jgi:hypothetical protein
MKWVRWLLLGLIVIAAAIALAPLVPLGSLKPAVPTGMNKVSSEELRREINNFVSMLRALYEACCNSRQDADYRQT